MCYQNCNYKQKSECVILGSPQNVRRTQDADGYYVSFSLEDKSVPSLISTDNIKTAVGIDVGLKEFLTTNTGETVSVPNFYRKSQSNLARKQRKVSRKEIGSNNWKKAL